MEIDVRPHGIIGSSRTGLFEITYKADNVTITEYFGYGEVEELRDQFIQAVEDLSKGTADYLKRALQDVSEDDLIAYLLEDSGLDYTIGEISHQTGKNITVEDEDLDE